MKQLALALALTGSCVLTTSLSSTPAFALETYEAKMEASDAASQARVDMIDAFGPKFLKPGQYVWRDVPEGAGPERVVISLSDQLAYLYRGDTLMAVATISSGQPGREPRPASSRSATRQPMYRSKKYDNAPMPFAQFIDQYGIAHARRLQPGSSGLARLHPAALGLRQEALHRRPASARRSISGPELWRAGRSRRGTPVYQPR